MAGARFHVVGVPSVHMIREGERGPYVEVGWQVAGVRVVVVGGGL